jgi:glycosyltransferase involved in cell wall biosynthesis
METPPDERTPLVSVVLPTYGRPEYVLDAIRSVGEQTYSPVELVVVDDHSPEPVAPVVRELDVDVASVECIRHGENRGANAARNTGIRAASGELLAFLDDDDRWTPRYLERAVRAFDDPHVGLVTVGARVVDEEGRTRNEFIPRAFSDDPLDDLLDGALVGSFSRFVVRASVVRDAGALDERLPSWQDWEWQFRLARHCRFAAVPEALVIRRFGSYGQITDDFEKRRDVSYPLFVQAHREAIANRSPADERRFVALLSRSLAASAMHTGRYRAALRYLLRALRHDPRATETYLYLAAALGGPLTHRPLQRLKRRLES